MMGVYIKGMQMPKNCHSCPMCLMRFCQAGDRELSEQETRPNAKRPEDCPLVPVPEPHGRLIDADALHKLFEDQWHYLQVLDWNENPTAEAKQSGVNWCINTMHDSAPTIVEAEDGE